MTTEAYISTLQERASAMLQHRLVGPEIAGRLEAAVQYAVNNGGKRIRPVLAYASAEAVGGNLGDADDCACAVELIHAYSLVHDDLPAMDDDALRRGQPTCHIQFDEATAILAGDALQALAFECLAGSSDRTTDASQKLEMIRVLATAAGWQGMVGGQSLDMEGAGNCPREEDLVKIHRLKTGALITASVKLGAMSTGRATQEELSCLEVFASCMGLAFQIKDDILDVEGDTQTLGKQQGKDQDLNKCTYPALLGLDEARNRLKTLFDEGLAALSPMGGRADNLIGIARYIVERQY